MTCGVGGDRYRFRGKLGPNHGGTTCVGLGYEKSTCNDFRCPISCKVSAWSAWGTCTKTCGAGGTQTRERLRDPPAQYGGKECDKELLQNVTCNKKLCKINCAWDQWGPYGKCSKTCGSGIKWRTRQIRSPARYGGEKCTGGYHSMATCNTHACPIDCIWGIWSSWTPCSKTCGSQGTQHMYRSPKVVAWGGGRKCVGENSIMRICPDLPSCAEAAEAAPEGEGESEAAAGEAEETTQATTTAPPKGGSHQILYVSLFLCLCGSFSGLLFYGKRRRDEKKKAEGDWEGEEGGEEGEGEEDLK